MEYKIGRRGAYYTKGQSMKTREEEKDLLWARQPSSQLFKECVFLERKKKVEWELLCLSFRFLRIEEFMTLIIPSFHT